MPCLTLFKAFSHSKYIPLRGIALSYDRLDERVGGAEGMLCLSYTVNLTNYNLENVIHTVGQATGWFTGLIQHCTVIRLHMERLCNQMHFPFISLPCFLLLLFRPTSIDGKVYSKFHKVHLHTITGALHNLNVTWVKYKRIQTPCES